MKHSIYLITIITLFISCKRNVHNEAALEVKETTIATQSSTEVDSITPQQVNEVKNKPKTKEKLWNEYWAKFTTAIKQKDKKTMLELALKPNEASLDGYSFEDGGGGGTAEDFVDYIDEDNTWKGWLSIANNKNIKITKEKNRNIIDDYMIFEFIKGRWIWIGIMGD